MRHHFPMLRLQRELRAVLQSQLGSLNLRLEQPELVIVHSEIFLGFPFRPSSPAFRGPESLFSGELELLQLDFGSLDFCSEAVLLGLGLRGEVVSLGLDICQLLDRILLFLCCLLVKLAGTLLLGQSACFHACGHISANSVCLLFCFKQEIRILLHPVSAGSCCQVQLALPRCNRLGCLGRDSLLLGLALAQALYVSLFKLKRLDFHLLRKPLKILSPGLMLSDVLLDLLLHILNVIGCFGFRRFKCISRLQHLPISLKPPLLVSFICLPLRDGQLRLCTVDDLLSPLLCVFNALAYLALRCPDILLRCELPLVQSPPLPGRCICARRGFPGESVYVVLV
mmetsp:Transcript_140974/g.249045  ORF Transcript_140974/g.249045 Transcript_140974/m.249045 type:complete len:340 (+) Transcript_140974:804-1823(+)